MYARDAYKKSMYGVRPAFVFECGRGKLVARDGCFWVFIISLVCYLCTAGAPSGEWTATS